MNIKEKMPNINPQSFINDYCIAHDIIDVKSFLTPTEANIEPITAYESMQVAYDLLNDNLHNKNKICILVDP